MFPEIGLVAPPAPTGRIGAAMHSALRERRNLLAMSLPTLEGGQGAQRLAEPFARELVEVAAELPVINECVDPIEKIGFTLASIS